MSGKAWVGLCAIGIIAACVRWAALPGCFIGQAYILSNIPGQHPATISVADKIQWHGVIEPGRQRVRFLATAEGGIRLSVRPTDSPDLLSSVDFGYLTPMFVDEYYFIVDPDRVAVADTRPAARKHWLDALEEALGFLDSTAACAVQLVVVWL